MSNNINPSSRIQIYKSLLIPFSTNPRPAESIYRAAGLQKTKGTIFIIPPPESILKSTYNAPPRPKTRMSSGAVALCKHFERVPDTPWAKRDQASGSRHPFWDEPKGSNESKTGIAAQILDQMLANACWRNVMLLHRGVAVYEIRNPRGWGMRWTLEVEEVDELNDTNHHLSQFTDYIDPAGTRAMAATSVDVAHAISVPTTNGSSIDLAGSTSSADVDLPGSDHDQGLNGDSSRQSESASLSDCKEWRIKNVTFRGFLEPIEGMDDEVLSNKNS